MCFLIAFLWTAPECDGCDRLEMMYRYFHEYSYLPGVRLFRLGPCSDPQFHPY